LAKESEWRWNIAEQGWTHGEWRLVARAVGVLGIDWWGVSDELLDGIGIWGFRRIYTFDVQQWEGFWFPTLTWDHLIARGWIEPD